MTLIIGFTHRLKNKRYADVECICYDIQEFMDLSRYNLKRTTNKANPDILTFVCSCVSKKTPKRQSSSLSTSLSFNSLKGIFSKVGQNDGLIKRRNFEACDFRINFKRLISGEYLLRKKFNFNHNHPPCDGMKVII
jgi:hypothetical protein